MQLITNNVTNVAFKYTEPCFRKEKTRTVVMLCNKFKFRFVIFNDIKLTQKIQLPNFYMDETLCEWEIAWVDEE